MVVGNYRDVKVNKTPEPVDECTGSEAKGLSGPPWGGETVGKKRANGVSKLEGENENERWTRSAGGRSPRCRASRHNGTSLKLRPATGCPDDDWKGIEGMMDRWQATRYFAGVLGDGETKDWNCLRDWGDGASGIPP